MTARTATTSARPTRTAAQPPLHTVAVDAHLVQQLVDIKRQLSAQRLSPSKTEEIITAHVLNRWFAQQGLPYEITVATNPTGWDGLLKVQGQHPSDRPMAVEFKSATRKGQGNCGFQFNPNTFVFEDHACIACAEFTEGLPVRMFVALAPGAARQCMAQLRGMLLSDGEGRASYDPLKRPNLNLWSASKRATSQRPHATPGLQDAAQAPGTGPLENRITVLDHATIAQLLGV